MTAQILFEQEGHEDTLQVDGKKTHWALIIHK